MFMAALTLTPLQVKSMRFSLDDILILLLTLEDGRTLDMELHALDTKVTGITMSKLICWRTSESLEMTSPTYILTTISSMPINKKSKLLCFAYLLNNVYTTVNRDAITRDHKKSQAGRDMMRKMVMTISPTPNLLLISNKMIEEILINDLL